MTTQVINQRFTSRPPGSIYIGPPSKWRNPFVIGPGGDREELIRLYTEWIKTQPTLLKAAQTELQGRVLVCWCKPLPCHGDVLARIAEGEVV